MKLPSHHSWPGKAVLLGALIAAAAGCNSSSDTTTNQVSTTVGSTGGTVALPGGPTLQIPAGALASSTAITIEDTGQTSAAGGRIYSFGPSGTTFSQPVQVEMPVGSGVTTPTVYWTKPGSTTLFDALPTTASGGSATARVDHFSLGYVGSAPAAATPTFSPAAGTYTTAQSVTISSTTPSASIYYTTNGSPPTTSSTLYTAPVAVAATTTIQAIATATGFSSSAVASATYTITGTLPVAATPTFSPSAGTYTTAQSVTISSTTPSASIYYTTNGSPPTTSSTLYTAPVAVAATTTIQAIATATGYTQSAVGSATYTIGGEGGPPFATVCQDLNNTILNLFTTCLHANPAVFSTFNPDAQFNCNEGAKAIAAGRATYDPAAGAACQSALASLTCGTLDTGIVVSPCLAALTGNVANGGTCWNDIECAAGTCSSSAATCPSTCASYATLGQSCTSAVCSPELVCDGATCRTPSPVGGGCPCQASAWCGAGNVCAARQTSGACNTSNFDQCALGYVCAGAAGNETCQQYVGLGATCVASADLCGPGYVCTGSTCASYPTLGQPCSDVCLGSYCDIQGTTPTCLALKDLGATCLFATECASGACSGSFPAPGVCEISYCAEP